MKNTLKLILDAIRINTEKILAKIPRKLSELEIDTELGVKSWNDLEDKPFYDSRKTVIKTKEIPINFTFDGNIEGKEIIDLGLGNGTYYVKLSDIPLTVDQMIGSNVSFFQGEESNFVFTEELIGQVSEAFISAMDRMVISVLQDYADLDGLILPKGFWGPCIPSELYISSFTNTKPIIVTTETIEGELKKIDPKFIPYGTPDWNQDDETAEGYIKLVRYCKLRS